MEVMLYYNITSIYIFLKILYLIITTGMSFSKRLKFFIVFVYFVNIPLHCQ